MKRLKQTLFGAAAMAIPLASLAAPTVYIPLGSANEILIVDAKKDKVIGKINGVVNPHGLASTTDGKYLIAGSNTERMGGQGKKSGMSKKSGMPKQSGMPAMPKPPGMSDATHKSHHPKQGGGASGMMGGQTKAPAKPAKSPTMAKPAGMSEADHKKHHAPQAGGLPPAVGISDISLIRVADNQVEKRIKVRGMAHHILTTPNGKYAVATHTTAGTITLIDLAKKKIFRTIHTGPLPNYVAVTRNSRRMYVSNAGNNTISVIDTKNWIVSKNIIVGKGPEHIIMSPDEKFIYTSNGRAGTISVVSLDQQKVVKTFKVGRSPHGIDISADGNTLFASAKKDNKLVAIDVKTGKQRSLKLNPAPYHVKVIGNTGKIYVSSRKKPFVWVVDAKKLKVKTKIPVRGPGHQMVVMN